MTSYVLSNDTGEILELTTEADAMVRGSILASAAHAPIALHVVLTHPNKAPKVGGSVSMKGIYHWFTP